MSYKKLDIFNIALELYFKAHARSLTLPKYELYDLGSQLRRSADSVVTNIVEGYGRRIYKGEYIRFLTYSHASNDETILHLTTLSRLYPEFSNDLDGLLKQYENLGGKINNYIQFVVKNWNVKPPDDK